MRHVYLYYRVDPARAILAAARVDALLQAMAPHCGRPPRRLARCDDARTWMEIYEDIVDWPAFEAALHRTATELDVTALTDGARHLECFTAPPT